MSDPEAGRPSSPTERPENSRMTSQPTPPDPSRLRESVETLPERAREPRLAMGGVEVAEQSSPQTTYQSGQTPLGDPEPTAPGEREHTHNPTADPEDTHADVRTSLLQDYHRARICGHADCDHGTFSPRPQSHCSRRSTYSIGNGFGARYEAEARGEGGGKGRMQSLFGDAFADSLFGGRRDTVASTTQRLAAKYSIGNQKMMYMSYYFPFLKWVGQYRWRWFRGDLVAALTMASFYIPMALSYASNLGHIPPINGLYSFVFNPVIYALLGTCPQMVVGPEAAGSLLVGTVVRTCIDRGQSGDDDALVNAQIAGVVTGIAGAGIFVAGITRLGFLDSVLSRPFLRGFISAIGFVILVEQAIPELGLTALSREVPDVDHGSSIRKLVFLFQNIGQSHALTATVSIVSFVIIMILRTLKRKLQPRFPNIAYFPDRFLVVAVSAILAWKLGWDEKGLDILGEVKSASSRAIPFHWPFQFQHMKHIDTALSTSFLIALLGFFESSVAAKSLGEGTHELQGMTLSANRELIALGTANIVGGCFMALPAFGGYGRSKVNASTGGTTPMSSVLLSVITLICVLFLLPYFYYLPKGVLSAMISVVAYSLIEECPHDIKFFIKIKGWTELSLMSIIFLATIFYSLSLGIALGIGLSLLQLIRHATKPRIQILGRVPGTTDKFENAELSPEHIEYLESCLIVKIPEPLTFANTGELKTRLRRLEHYGIAGAHPSLPRVRHDDSNRNIILDVHGVTSIDGSGVQVLTEIVEDYLQRGARVFFCRTPSAKSQVFKSFELSGIVDMVGKRNFVDSVEEALKLSEIEDLQQYFDDRMDGA